MRPDYLKCREVLLDALFPKEQHRFVWVVKPGSHMPTVRGRTVGGGCVHVATYLHDEELLWFRVDRLKNGVSDTIICSTSELLRLLVGILGVEWDFEPHMEAALAQEKAKRDQRNERRRELRKRRKEKADD